MSAKAEKFSVVIPVYRAENYLKQCVESVLSQTHSNIEVVLVDDESPDKCPVICDLFADKDTRVQVIHKKNEGAALARKAGLEAATGEYVLFIDCDDWLETNTIISLCCFLFWPCFRLTLCEVRSAGARYPAKRHILR